MHLFYTLQNDNNIIKDLLLNFILLLTILINNNRLFVIAILIFDELRSKFVVSTIIRLSLKIAFNIFDDY